MLDVPLGGRMRKIIDQTLSYKTIKQYLNLFLMTIVNSFLIANTM